jgi:hypothetical protein
MLRHFANLTRRKCNPCPRLKPVVRMMHRSQIRARRAGACPLPMLLTSLVPRPSWCTRLNTPETVPGRPGSASPRPRNAPQPDPSTSPASPRNRLREESDVPSQTGDRATADPAGRPAAVWVPRGPPAVARRPGDAAYVDRQGYRPNGSGAGAPADCKGTFT